MLLLGYKYNLPASAILGYTITTKVNKSVATNVQNNKRAYVFSYTV